MPISDMVRHRIISLRIGPPQQEREIEAIEYTYIYEKGGRDSATTMAHGYCVVEGNAVLFVQHTSSQAISSELAFEMMGQMLAKQLKLDGNPYVVNKSKIIKSNH